MKKFSNNKEWYEKMSKYIIKKIWKIDKYKIINKKNYLNDIIEVILKIFKNDLLKYLIKF